MKITKQYLKQLIMEELEEGIEIPGAGKGTYDHKEKKYNPAYTTDPAQNLKDMLISLQVAIQGDNKEKAIELVNAVRSMVVQFSRSEYTGDPEHGAEFIEKVRTGKGAPYSMD